MELLGIGLYGHTAKVMHINSKKMYALKKLVENVESVTHKVLVAINLKEDSPYLIQYYKKIEFNNEIYILMNFAENGKLSDLINNLKSQNSYLNESVCLFHFLFLVYKTFMKYFAMLVIAISILHKNNIFHYDLNPCNIFQDNDMNIIVGKNIMFI
jgi:serine/threonine protein kinase